MIAKSVTSLSLTFIFAHWAHLIVRFIPSYSQQMYNVLLKSHVDLCIRFISVCKYLLNDKIVDLFLILETMDFPLQ